MKNEKENWKGTGGFKKEKVGKEKGGLEKENKGKEIEKKIEKIRRRGSPSSS